MVALEGGDGSGPVDVGHAGVAGRAGNGVDEVVEEVGSAQPGGVAGEQVDGRLGGTEAFGPCAERGGQGGGCDRGVFGGHGMGPVVAGRSGKPRHSNGAGAGGGGLELNESCRWRRRDLVVALFWPVRVGSPNARSG